MKKRMGSVTYGEEYGEEWKKKKLSPFISSFIHEMKSALS
jgi:hypothetical protein